MEIDFHLEGVEGNEEKASNASASLVSLSCFRLHWLGIRKIPFHWPMLYETVEHEGKSLE